jgi:hypothetical protein
MTIPTNPIAPFSPFLGSTYDLPEEADRLKTSLSDNFSLFADTINDKKIGAYTENTETQNGNKFSYDTTKKVRNGSQAISRITSFVTQSIPLPISNVNSQFIISLVYGSASKPCSAVGSNDGDYFSFFSQGDARIQFTMTDTTLNITATAPMVDYQGFIVIEFIRDGT